jgi:hypothetical protein
MLREFRAAAASVVRGGDPEVSPAVGRLLEIVAELDAALEMGLAVTMNDLTTVEFRGLVILREERSRAAEMQRGVAEAAAKVRQAPRGTF